MGLSTASPTTQSGRSSQSTSSQGHFHQIRIFKLFHAYVQSCSSKVLFQVLLSTEMKEYIFFDASSIQKNDCTFGTVISRRDEKHLGCSLLFWSRMLWTACLWLFVLKWVFHSTHYPLRKEIIVECLGIYFLSYHCNLEDADIVYWIRKTQENVLSVKKSFASVPVSYSE